MSAIYFAIPTNAGQAKIANALALGIPLKITAMAVGDGGGQAVTPDPAMTTLPGEKRRAPINTLFQDPLNPAQLVAEQIIPENVGGWWIRCVSLYDETGTMIAIANSPDTYKPQLSEGSGRTQTIRMVLIVSDTSAVELKIDPSVVLATRKYVDDVMKAHKESRDHPDASETAKGFSRFATQVEVNETTADDRVDAVVTVKTLWGWVKQASEAVLGMIKVATQSQTDAGAADDMAVTPKKLKNGFSCNLGPTGYIALPSFLKNVTIQWGVGTSLAIGVNSNIFPIAFSNICAAVVGTALNVTINSDVFECAGNISKTMFTSAVVSSGAPGGSVQVVTEYRWIAIGY